jgi:nitroreductase
MLHHLIVERRSPRAFDAHAVLGEDQVDTLLEAAGLAPSAMNRQPWAFLVGHRGDRVFKGIADALSGRNQLWAPSASVLVVAMVDNHVPDAPTDPGRAYELGLAMGQLGLQAVAMIAQTFGLTADDVTTSVAPAVDGTPVLFAVLQVQPNHEESQ